MSALANHELRQPKVGERYLYSGFEYEVLRIDQAVVTIRGVNAKRQSDIPLLRWQDLAARGRMTALVEHAEWQDLYRNAANLTDKEATTHQRRLAYVQAFERELLGRAPTELGLLLIKRVAEERSEKPPSISRVRFWLRQYREAGKNPLALITREHRTRQRKPRMNHTVIELTQSILRSTFLDDRRPSAQAIYHLLCAEIEGENLKRNPEDKLRAPSRASFYRTVATLDAYDADLNRHGKQYAKRKHRHGVRIHPPSMVLERVESDSNYVDLIVVDENGDPIGRPVLTVLIDIFSRCVLGWDLSFVPPCAAKTLRAYKDALSSENGRLAGGAPIELIVDGGPEFRNSSLFQVAERFGTSVRIVSPREPNEKPHVERFFRTMNTTFIHLMHGTTRSSPQDRGDYRAVKNAWIQLEELRERFAAWLEQIYHNSLHSELGMPPSVAWKKATELDTPTRYRDEGLDMVCRKSAERTISGGRVQLFNLCWTSPALPDLAARLAQHPEKDRVTVLYDETDLDHVFVVDPEDSTRLVRADPVDARYQKGLTLTEHQAASTALKAAGKEVTNTILLNQARKRLWDELDLSTTKARKRFARMQNEKMASRLRAAGHQGQLASDPDASALPSEQTHLLEATLPSFEESKPGQSTVEDIWDEEGDIFKSL